MFVSFDREVTPVWFKLVFAYGGIDVLEMTVILLLPIIIIYYRRGEGGELY